ncbi:hypothetical protein CHUAL_014267 [Chamberlinius hualienensis]
MDFISNFFQTFLLLLLPFTCFDPFIPLKLAINQYDFIIVGAGSAGSVLANRLTENPSVKVLLLEAGGCPSILSQIPTASRILVTVSAWNYQTASQNNSFLSYNDKKASYPVGKLLGGSSSINGMLYVRGNEWDYNNWSAMGNTEWAWQDVLPYFLKAEGNRIPEEENDKNYHNTKGPLIVSFCPFQTPSLDIFLKAGEEIGYLVTDVNGRNQSGVTKHPLNLVNGERCSAANAYIEPAKSRSNLLVVTNAVVTKILFNTLKEAIGVEYIYGGMQFTSKASKEVILSAGAIGSPKLLMLSGVGPKADLQQLNIPVVVDVPGVGHNLIDHVGCGALIWSVNCSDCTYDISGALTIPNILNWVFQRNGSLTSYVGNEGMAYTNVDPATNVPTTQMLYVSANVASQLSVMSSQTGTNLDDMKKYFDSFSTSKAFSIYVFNVNPKSRGTVKLQSNDPAKPPIIDPNYFSDEDDVKGLIEGVKTAFKMGNSKAFASIGAKFNPTVYPGCEGIALYSDSYWECVIRHFSLPGYHPCGTCKMGVSGDKNAVVNQRLKVYGVSKLRVVDASVMPAIPNGNLNAGVNMIAEKVSDSIKSEYGLNV